MKLKFKQQNYITKNYIHEKFLMIETKKKYPLKKILILYNLYFYLNLNVIKKIHYCIFIKIYF